MNLLRMKTPNGVKLLISPQCNWGWKDNRDMKPPNPERVEHLGNDDANLKKSGNVVLKDS